MAAENTSSLRVPETLCKAADSRGLEKVLAPSLVPEMVQDVRFAVTVFWDSGGRFSMGADTYPFEFTLRPPEKGRIPCELYLDQDRVEIHQIQLSEDVYQWGNDVYVGVFRSLFVEIRRLLNRLADGLSSPSDFRVFQRLLRHRKLIKSLMNWIQEDPAQQKPQSFDAFLKPCWDYQTETLRPFLADQPEHQEYYDRFRKAFLSLLAFGKVEIRHHDHDLGRICRGEVEVTDGMGLASSFLLSFYELNEVDSLPFFSLNGVFGKAVPQSVLNFFAGMRYVTLA